MKLIFLIIIALTLNLNAQTKQLQMLYENDDYYIWTPVTGTNEVAEGSGLIYGGIPTKVRSVSPKDSGGTKFYPYIKAWYEGDDQWTPINSTTGYSLLLSPLEDTLIYYKAYGFWIEQDSDTVWAYGADSVFVTSFTAPQIFAYGDTLENYITVTDTNFIVDTFSLYKSGVTYDTLVTVGGGTFSDSGITEGAYYKIKSGATYSYIFSDSFYVEPIVPVLTAATQLTAIPDTNGIKTTWVNGVGQTSIILRRGQVGQSMYNLDTLASNIGEYCDTISTLAADSEFVYDVVSLNALSSVTSNKDTATAYYVLVAGDTLWNTELNIDLESALLTEFRDTVLSNGTVSIGTVNTPPQGSYDFISTSTGTNGYAFGEQVIPNQIAAGDTYWVYVKFYGNSNSAAAGTYQQIMSVGDSLTSAYRGGFQVQIRLNASGLFYMLRPGGYGIAATATSVTLDAQWNTVIAMVKTSATSTSADGEMVYYLNGSQVGAKQTGLNTAYSTTVVRPRLTRLGFDAGAVTAANDSLIIDDFRFATDSLSLYATITASSLYPFNCAQDEPPNPPSQVLGLDTVLVSSTGINLIWYDLSDETSYKIERKLSSQGVASFAQIYSNSANDTTYTDSLLNSSTSYTYRVRANNTGGFGNYSDTLVVQTDALTGNPTFDYYVSATATGSGDGSASNPFTVSQANAAAVADDTILVKNGTYNFTSRFIFSNGGTIASPVVWVGESKGNVKFVANHYSTVDAFVIADNCITMDSIYFYGQPTATRSVIQVEGDYVTLKNGESHYRAGGSATDNDNIRGDNIKHFFMQNWLADSSAWNAINLQTTTSTGNTAQGLRHITFDNVEITNMLNHNGFNIFPATNLANPDYIDSVTIKNCWVHDMGGGSSAMLSRHIRMFDIFNNIFESDLGLSSGDSTPLDTLDVSYPDRKSTIVHNTFIAHPSGTKPGINNFIANGLIIKNNAFYGEFYNEYYFRFEGYIADIHPIYRHEINYNLYYQTTSDNEVWRFNNSYTSFASWKSVSSQDANSLNPTKATLNDAIFNNVGNDDYTPKAGSPLIDAAQDLDGTYSFLATDKAGNSRATNPDIGAYEYVP